MATKNGSLQLANKAKNDEFYTQLPDIENELRHYKHHFEGKTVLCNCDDPRVSNFFKYFSYNFEALKLKRLISTCYKSQERDLFSQGESEHAIWLDYNGDKNGNRIPDPEEIGIQYFKGDGDFRSEECVELLKQADIVVTNPPFSLFREYIAQLIRHDKKFLIIGNSNAITYKEVFPLIQSNKMWLGVTRQGTGSMWFAVSDNFPEKSGQKTIDGIRYQTIGSSAWFTNLEHSKRHEEIILYKNYSPEEYPKYDNYDAIEVSKVDSIPCNYDGVMGVPITFLGKYNPEQFEIVKFRKGNDDKDLMINGKCPYFRILIRRIQ